MSTESSSFANEVYVGSTFSKENWEVKSYKCLIGCSNRLGDFLKEQIGGNVSLSESHLVASFTDRCMGRVVFRKKSIPVTLLVKQLKEGVHPRSRRKITRNALGLFDNSVDGGLFFCEFNGVESVFLQVLSIENGRILLLFEQLSLIELR